MAMGRRGMPSSVNMHFSLDAVSDQISVYNRVGRPTE